LHSCWSKTNWTTKKFLHILEPSMQFIIYEGGCLYIHIKSVCINFSIHMRIIIAVYYIWSWLPFSTHINSWFQSQETSEVLHFASGRLYKGSHDILKKMSLQWTLQKHLLQASKRALNAILENSIVLMCYTAVKDRWLWWYCMHHIALLKMAED
jgi:hypothetical protein